MPRLVSVLTLALFVSVVLRAHPAAAQTVQIQVTPQPVPPPPQATVVVAPGYAPGPAVYAQYPGAPMAPGYAMTGPMRADEADRLVVARMIVSPLIGYAVGTGLAIAGALTGLALCSDATHDIDHCLEPMLAGIFVGYLLGAPLGVTWASSWFKGLGNYGWALLGTVVGIAAAIPIAAVSADDTHSLAYVVGGLPAVGSMLFYELRGAARARHLRQGTELYVAPLGRPVMAEGRVVGGAFGLSVSGF